MEEKIFVDKLCEIGKEMGKREKRDSNGNTKKENDNEQFIRYCLDLIVKYRFFSEPDVRKVLTTKFKKGKDDALIKELKFTPAVAILSQEREYTVSKDGRFIYRNAETPWEHDGNKYYVSTQWGDENKPKFASWLYEKLDNIVDDSEWDEIIKDIDKKIDEQDQIKNQQTEYATSSGINGELRDSNAVGDEKKYKYNLIYFGAPGTGKSNELNQDKDELLGDGKEDRYERVTFHPDYSYAHFVGTYKPVPDDNGGITYKFVPGPFLRVYVNAKNNSGSKYLLIIEEINRANVAAVFGDVFQLLDRNKDGESEYPIAASEDILRFLQSEKGKNLVQPDEDRAELRIPKNMYIWATMNSADQGVFPMDTAFKRRWDFKYIGIDKGEEKLLQDSITVGDSTFTWNNIRKAINHWLAGKGVNEDKQMGPFFLSSDIVGKEATTIDQDRFLEAFKSKVLMYLFEDAAKQKRKELFNKELFKDVLQYSKICSQFEERGLDVFVNTIKDEAVKKSEAQDNNTAPFPSEGQEK